MINRRQLIRAVLVGIPIANVPIFHSSIATAEVATTLAMISSGTKIAKSLDGLFGGSKSVDFSELHIKLDVILENQAKISKSLSDLADQIVDLQRALSELPTGVVNALFVERVQVFHKTLRNELRDHGQKTEDRLRRDVRDEFLSEGKGLIAALENRLDKLRPGYDTDLTDWASSANGFYNSLMLFAMTEMLTPGGKRERLGDIQVDMKQLASLCDRFTGQSGKLATRMSQLEKQYEDKIAAGLPSEELKSTFSAWLLGDDVGTKTLIYRTSSERYVELDLSYLSIQPPTKYCKVETRARGPASRGSVLPKPSDPDFGGVFTGNLGGEPTSLSCVHDIFHRLTIKKVKIDDVDHGLANAKINAVSNEDSIPIPKSHAGVIRMEAWTPPANSFDSANALRSRYRTLSISADLARRTQELAVGQGGKIGALVQ